MHSSIHFWTSFGISFPANEPFDWSDVGRENPQLFNAFSCQPFQTSHSGIGPGSHLSMLSLNLRPVCWQYANIRSKQNVTISNSISHNFKFVHIIVVCFLEPCQVSKMERFVKIGTALAVNYFCKTLRCRCLTVFCIRLHTCSSR